MSQKRFEERHEQDWQQLEAIYRQAHKKRPKAADGDEAMADIAALPQLYRKASHQLAIAKHRRYSPYLIERLNQLVMQGHHRLYQNNQVHRGQFMRFVAQGFPTALRRNATYVWVACALFLLPGLLMGLGCYAHEDLIYSVMAPDQVNSFDQMYNPEAGKLGRERESDTDWAMFGFYIKNNIGIAFRTFASGIVFGLGSIFFLVFNGLHIGAVTGHIAQIGYYDTFFPFVVGHGAFELTAIVFSGAAGLKLGFALIAPGRYRRSVAVRHAASDAIQIMYGVALMLLIAAFLEAFWSSSSTLPIAVKYATGALLWLLVICYCVFSGKGQRHGS